MTRDRRTDRVLGAMFGTARALMIVAASAGIVHIVSILALPRLAMHNAYAKLAATTPSNQIVPLPRTGPGSAQAPFDDPAFAQGVCRYDLTQGPLRLRGTLATDALTLFSFHTQTGQVFYAMSDRGAVGGRLNVVLALAPQLEALQANDNDDVLPEDLRIAAPEALGMLLIRALAETPSAYREAERRIAALTCAPDVAAASPP